jgi:hypothetical protein
MKDVIVKGIVCNGINSDWSEYQRTGTMHLFLKNPTHIFCRNYEARREITLDLNFKHHTVFDEITTIERILEGNKYDPWRYMPQRLAEILEIATTDLGPDTKRIRPYKKICMNCVRALATHIKRYIEKVEDKQKKINIWKRQNGFVSLPEKDEPVESEDFVVSDNTGYKIYGAFILNEDYEGIFPGEDGYEFQSDDLNELFDNMQSVKGSETIRSLLEEKRIKVYETRTISVKVSFKKVTSFNLDEVEINT